MVDVRGRWALITGASRGLGCLLAKFMAEQGCNLILHSRELEHTIPVEREVEALGVKVFSQEANLANNNEVIRMLDKIEDLGIEVDIVFNNASVQGIYHPEIWNTSIEDFEMCFRSNIIAVATICYCLIPFMIERGFGRVINTTSGIRDVPELAGYAASKASLDKFTTDLATKLDGTNVMLNLTDPGWCRTDMGGSLAPNSPESSLPGIALGAFLDDQRSGRLFSAQDFTGMTLEAAVARAEEMDHQE